MTFYTVQAGDSLFAIAQKFGISLDSLRAANRQLNGGDDIDVGQVLSIPGRGGPSEAGNSDIDRALAIHNQARRDASNQHGHGRPDLTWDANLANDAQGWANELASTGSFKHSGTKGQGENLYAASNGASFADASQAWVNEQKNYHGEPIGQGNFGSYGHYTQVIWPSTTRVGIATAKGGNGWTYAVARYEAQGNFTGQSAF